MNLNKRVKTLEANMIDLENQDINKFIKKVLQGEINGCQQKVKEIIGFAIEDVGKAVKSLVSVTNLINLCQSYNFFDQFSALEQTKTALIQALNLSNKHWQTLFDQKLAEFKAESECRFREILEDWAKYEQMQQQRKK